ncbi:Predicted pyrophosphatase or phosphodiesterase, AlkP superfamily [Rubritalea squalenifaciens DSM 18772]|uniref:Predicted pyrophosphatase or phosphodiesterase, AlkP superfamily n=1 Tax=Rubritalea squalenifaciens DSM 18772 TaxID=1123071 RepID=A0A1M6LJB3_9BACT|nr:nucleotide pyrophosphatase/phosphodiesterase family protein [Rubritalea squalenifaciens]SHJ71218.1 Predicted pyrophosphatase or phosphodiesterase, AlkP superfamily [Rubritalea squalenifaciens DSM 18772]
MNRVAVINVVGLTKSQLGEDTPRLNAFVEKCTLSAFPPAFPAVTCTAQSSYVTGRSEAEHGIVGNGWYDREAAEHKFWKQSNHIVKGEKVWDVLRRELPGFTCAKLFWWYNMYSTADWSITPRPMYPADGRKVFDVYTQPMDMREEIKADLGEFPFPTFWGPMAGIPCSEWIANSARWVERKHQPTLSLVYLPHLDYGLQKYGPGAPEMKKELQDIDRVAGELIEYYEQRGIEVILLSEYGISKVSKPIHLNRIFREKGWITIKDELGLEQLDCGASKVFAIADHQVAHVYLNDMSLLEEVKKTLLEVGGVEEVRMGKELWGEGTPGAERGGDLVAVSEEDAWFTYYYWTDDAVAPDYARCIDIHRKPGYDPVELFFDPAIKNPKVKAAKFLLKKKLGFRGLLDVIPLDASLVKGSHGRDKVREDEMPILASAKHGEITKAEDVFQVILDSVRG